MFQFGSQQMFPPAPVFPDALARLGDLSACAAVPRSPAVLTKTTVRHSPELFPVWKMLQILGAFREQRCPHIGISPEFGGLSGAFWGVFRAATVALYTQKLFESFFEEKKDKNSVLFWELLRPFGSKWKLFGVFRAILRIAQIFLCYFLKNSEFGRTPKF